MSYCRRNLYWGPPRICYFYQFLCIFYLLSGAILSQGKKPCDTGATLYKLPWLCHKSLNATKVLYTFGLGQLVICYAKYLNCCIVYFLHPPSMGCKEYALLFSETPPTLHPFTTSYLTCYSATCCFHLTRS